MQEGLGMRAFKSGSITCASAFGGMFYPGKPTWVIWAVVLLGRFFPALQFTSLNSLTYADIERHDVGRATSLGSFIQQVSLGLGVTVGGIALQISLICKEIRRSSGRISGRPSSSDCFRFFRFQLPRS